MSDKIDDGREFLPKTLEEVLNERTEKDDRLKIYNRRWSEYHSQSKMREESTVSQEKKGKAGQ